MESVAKQWVVVREISQHVTSQLERVSRLLQEIPKEAIFNPVQKPNPLTKIAIGVSGLAITLSLISLSMSQNVRTSVLSKEMAAASRPLTRSENEVVEHTTPRSSLTYAPKAAPHVSASELGRSRRRR